MSLQAQGCLNEEGGALADLALRRAVTGAGRRFLRFLQCHGEHELASHCLYAVAAALPA